MKKKIIIFIITCILFVSICSCSNKKENQTFVKNEIEDNAEILEKNENINYPDLSQIRSICQLATLECYYHNVAKSTKEKGQGLMHIGEKDRIFWIEYSGVAKFGIDISKISMEIDDEKIMIVIPKAELQELSDYSFTEDSYIVSDDGINKNPITAQNQTEAIAAAEADIKMMFENDDLMLTQAQNNAKSLIENYINQIGQISDIKYQITWCYEDNTIENDNEME